MTTEDVKILPFDPGPLVLVVDDEPRVRAGIARLVRSLGYRARSCPGGRSALRFLTVHPREVALLLTDVGMPHMDGGELAKRAKDLDPRLITVLMASPDDRLAGELLSGYRDVPFVPKPVSFGDLAEKLERLLGIPARPTRPLRSMRADRPRPRRRPSGQHRG
jgi:CheY-like chemotaxis protein